MNKNFLQIFGVVVGAMLSLYVVANIIGGGGNVVASFYRYIPPAVFLFGLLSPKGGLHILFAMSCFLGVLKKFLILDGRFSYFELYFILGAPAFLVLGIAISTFLREVVFVRQARKESPVVCFVFIALSLLVMATFYLVLKKGVNIAIMGGAFVNIGWILYYNIRDRSEVVSLFRSFLLALFVSALVGFKQSFFGLSYLDFAYLETGYVFSQNEAYDAFNPRPFSTYGTPGQYGWAMVVAFAICLILVTLERTKKKSLVRWFGLGLMLTFFAFAVLSSEKKAPMIGVVSLPLSIFLVRTNLRMIFGFCALASLVTFIGFQGQWLSDRLKEISPTLVAIDPNLSLNSFNVRIESFQAAFGQTASIPLLGSASGVDKMASHTLITDILFRIGYIPTVFLVVIVFTSLLLFRSYIFRRVRKDAQLVSILSICAGCFLTILAGGIIGTSSYQAFPVSLYWWAMAGLLLVFAFRESLPLSQEEEGDVQIPKPEVGRLAETR